ncbi:MAG TPA: aminotransferase class IV [Streptosporangiaceae bacterium]
MPGILPPRVEINGRPAGLEQFWVLDAGPPGHFTAMQVRGGATAGLQFHLDRLDGATRELFGMTLDGASVRELIRHALAGHAEDASVRVSVHRPDLAAELWVVVSVRPPAEPPRQGLVLQSVSYRRPAAHIKHTTGFGQAYFGGLASGNGFDEALFTGAGGVISEGSITNIGFADAGVITWPDAPALRGVMMQVLQRELSRAAVPWRYQTVRLADLPGLGGAFLTNSHGMATVARIDHQDLPAGSALIRDAAGLLAAASLDQI